MAALEDRSKLRITLMIMAALCALTVIEYKTRDMSAPQPIPPTAISGDQDPFGSIQNDSTGYSGLAWGTSISAFLRMDTGPKASTVASAQNVSESADGTTAASAIAAVESGPSEHDSESAGKAVQAEGAQSTALDAVATSTKQSSSTRVEADVIQVVPEVTNNVIQEGEFRRAVLRILGVPDEQRSIGVTDYTMVAEELVPKVFQSVTRNDIEYIFYRGELAMTFAHLNASSYDAVLARLGDKGQQVGSFDETWNKQQMDEHPDTEEVHAILFKRTQTNTRVYLIRDTNHATGLGFETTAALLVYIPNYYYQRIQSDVTGTAKQVQDSALTAEREKARPDVQKAQ